VSFLTHAHGRGGTAACLHRCLDVAAALQGLRLDWILVDGYYEYVEFRSELLETVQESRLTNLRSYQHGKI
jgi:hypothetical protein